MKTIDASLASGRLEFRKANSQGQALFLSAFLFGIFVNLLMLTGPLFMLQVYDRVLASRSSETLVALFILVGALYFLLAMLDYARGRIISRVGARLQSNLDVRVFEAILTNSISSHANADSTSMLHSLDALQDFYSPKVLLTLMDLFWTPIFLIAIFLFHPLLGWLALAGGGFLILLALVNQFVASRKVRPAHSASERAQAFAVDAYVGAEEIRAQGMQSKFVERWRDMRREALRQSLIANDWSGSLTSLTKASRYFLQSAMLALGAYLVLKGEVTGGAIIASSFILGRALAPVEQALGQWSTVIRARSGKRALEWLLAMTQMEQPKTKLPPPSSTVSVSGLTIIPPGSNIPTVRKVSFKIDPGHVLGVVGRSGSGKSTLAKAIIGFWPAAIGEVRLGGANLEQYDRDDLGKYIGYLPQAVTFFDGTVAQNISRMSASPDEKAVITAAKQANAHDLITGLADGYDTVLGGLKSQLSGGQLQRIALARALYGNPTLLVLDEPNSSLDADGSAALNQSVRRFKKAGKSVIIMTHRPAALTECDQLLILEGGQKEAFGPRDEVLKTVLKNAADVTKVFKVGTTT